jgi:hypothetical protein
MSPTEKGHGALESISLKSNLPKGKQRNFRDFDDPEGTGQRVWFAKKQRNGLLKNNRQATASQGGSNELDTG